MSCAMKSVVSLSAVSGATNKIRSKAPALPRCFGLGHTALPTPAPMRLRKNGSLRSAKPVAVKASAEFHEAITHVSNLISTIADADVVEAVPKDNGWLNPIVNTLEFVLKVIDNGLEGAGVPYSYGFSIILLTILVKVVTFPLSKQQVESTLAMQTLQPRIKELQSKYQFDKERLQMETAKLYQDAGVNPLAGCLPTLATLPVWIGLYRALSDVADEGLLTEGFFWVPSLAGPSSLAAQQEGGGLAWLLPLGENGPPVGWHDAIAYLVLPIALIVSQYISQAIISPQSSQDESQQQANAILKFLPIMIGWFALNVPSGLSLYWITNNVLTTAQQVYLRSATKAEPATAGAGASSGGGYTPPPSQAVVDVTPTEAVAGETRRERRQRERDAKRGARFAERKAKEAKKKESVTVPASTETEPETPSSPPPSA